MAPKAQNAVKAPPNQTLYVSNLNEKLRKNDLCRELYMLFSTYGSVLDIVALKTTKMRGQAHVVFKDIATATQALRHLEGFEFFGKPLRIQYARSKSDFVAKLDGSFKMPAVDGAPATTAGAAAGDAGTVLQQSVFSGAPGKVPLPMAQGTKRAREDAEESDAQEEEEAEMEMDESDDD